MLEFVRSRNNVCVKVCVCCLLLVTKTTVVLEFSPHKKEFPLTVNIHAREDITKYKIDFSTTVPGNLMFCVGMMQKRVSFVRHPIPENFWNSDPDHESGY